MEMESKKQGRYSVVKFLNKLGYIVCEIDNRYYVTTYFEEANNNSWKHSLEGKDITSVIDSFIHLHELNESQRQTVIQKVESITKTKKFFHKDITFILHMGA